MTKSFGTNAQTHKENIQSAELSHAEIAELEASVITITKDITEMTDADTELDAATAEATILRDA